jgi:hypothetical protein
MWQVIIHPAVQDWLDAQPQQVRERFDQCAWVLKAAGPALGRPLVDSIKGSTIHNLKELRVQSGTNLSIRALFVFDPKRQAIVLVVGDKAGEWNSWYKENLTIAEERYEEYLNHG